MSGGLWSLTLNILHLAEGDFKKEPPLLAHHFPCPLHPTIEIREALSLNSQVRVMESRGGQCLMGYDDLI